jgi:tetratricopeptide (TPR) repeat protein
MTSIFVSYSHQDEAWKNKLVKHLKVLESADIAIALWEDRQIQAGDAWRDEIAQAIDSCDIALLLVSADFLTSKFILGDEVPPLLQRRVKGGVRLIPVIVSSCVWTVHKWLADTQARPHDGKPLNKLGKAKQDEVLAQLTNELLKLHQQGLARRTKDNDPPAGRTASAEAPDVTVCPVLSPTGASATSAPSFSESATFPAHTAPQATHTPAASNAALTLWGRDLLLSKLRQGLTDHEALVVYGFRGNGKSALIQSLQQQPLPGVPTMWLRINAASERNANALFARLAELLGDRSELPQAPSGAVDKMASELQRRCPSPQPVVLWVDRGHTWFSAGGKWADEGLGRLIRALRRAYGQHWRWVLELREQPASVLSGTGTLVVEVPGIDRRGLSAWLEASAPSGQRAAWAYGGDALIRLYQWLGNRRTDDRSQAANPMATQLLIEVARAHGQTPMQVLDRLLLEVEDRVDNVLLSDLYGSVLSDLERTLLDALALYRVGIPLEHADMLEQQLGTPGAWDGLQRRCLLAADALQERHHLHGFVAGWVRHRLGYAPTDELWTDADPPEELDAPQRTVLRRLHTAVADAWMQHLGNTRRIAAPTLERAREALHHALSAGRADRLDGIATELLGGRHRDEVLQRLWDFYRRLFERRADVPAQIAALQVIVRLDERDAKAWRFLGENLRRQNAPIAQVQHCFEQALSAIPDFPPYLANLGQCLLSQGRTGAETFLNRLARHREDHPDAVNDYVQSIEAECLETTGQGGQASQLRRACIDAGTRNAVFYNAEAEYQLHQPGNIGGGPARAIELLDLATKRGVDTDYSASIRATALEAAGRSQEASALRQARIADETINPAFYSAEAAYLLRAGQSAQASRLLELARKRGVVDHLTEPTVRRLQSKR